MPETRQSQETEAPTVERWDAESGKSHSSLECGVMSDHGEESDEGSGGETAAEGSHSSLLTRESHEKFIREAVEVILREAVFEVSVVRGRSRCRLWMVIRFFGEVLREVRV